MNFYLNIYLKVGQFHTFEFSFFPCRVSQLRDSQATVTRLKEIRDQIRRKSLPSLFTFGFRKILKFHQQTFYPFYFFFKKFRSRKQRGERRNHTSPILIPSHRRMRYRLSILRDSIPQTFFSKNRFVEAWIWLFPFHPPKSNLFYSNSESWSLLLRRTIIEKLHKYLVISRTTLSMRESTFWS